MYENIIVMFYIILLIIVTIVIILYSRDIYQEVSVSNEDFENLEIAMSYINVKLRQNDRADAINIKALSETGENALVITQNKQDTWIYQRDDELIETKSEVGEEPNTLDYIKIADISDFDIEQNGDLVSYSITTNEDLKESSALLLISQS